MPDIDPRSLDPRSRDFGDSLNRQEFGSTPENSEFSLRDALFGCSHPVSGVIENHVNLSLRTWSDGTHVVIAELADFSRRFTGTARCHPVDTFDYDTGYAIAASRALKAYTDHLLNQVVIPDGC